jgi:hypothetical protein
MNPSGSDFNKCHAHARQEPVQARWQYRMVTWTYRDTCLLRETPNEAWPLSVVGVGFQNHGTPVVQNHSPPGVPHRVTGGTSLMRPPVRRSAGSFPASFGRSLTVTPLRVPLGSCDQVPGGLSPPSQCPCWAYPNTRGHPEGWPPGEDHRLDLGSFHINASGPS